MIFIAKDADFSVNNLGQVSVKTVDDISADTWSLLSLYGKTWTDDQKIAIDDFNEGLKAKSWFSKVKHVFVPIMCPLNNNLTSMSIINSDTNIGYDLISRTKITLVAGNGAYSANYGMLKVGQNGIQKDLEHSTFINNFSPYININATTIKDDNVSVFYYFINLGNSYTQIGLVEKHMIAIVANQIIIHNRANSPTNMWTLQDEKGGLCVGLNCSASGDFVKYYAKGNIINGTYEDTAAVETIKEIQLQRGSNANPIIGFCSIGTAMTSEEFKEYGDMIKVFMEALISL